MLHKYLDKFGNIYRAVRFTGSLPYDLVKDRRVAFYHDDLSGEPCLRVRCEQKQYGASTFNVLVRKGWVVEQPTGDLSTYSDSEFESLGLTKMEKK